MNQHVSVQFCNITASTLEFSALATRNPYERVVSSFFYLNKKKRSVDLSTVGVNGLVTAFKSHVLEKKFNYLRPLTSFITSRSGIVVTPDILIRHETLLFDMLNLTRLLGFENKSSDAALRVYLNFHAHNISVPNSREVLYESLQRDSGLSTIIREYFRRDFELFYNNTSAHDLLFGRHQ